MIENHEGLNHAIKPDELLTLSVNLNQTVADYKTNPATVIPVTDDGGSFIAPSFTVPRTSQAHTPSSLPSRPCPTTFRQLIG